MKEIYFWGILLPLFGLAFAKLDRKIEINKCSETEKTTTTRRTLKTYRTKSAPPVTRRTTTHAAVIDQTCLLEPDVGPCRGSIVMWYFDPDNMTCATFYWGGCQGNGNRFDKRRQCLDTCMTKPGYKEGKPRYCSLRFDYGWCFGAAERWYYDSQWGVCKKTIYSGCGGNKNNFYNIEQCDQICRFGLKPLTHISRAKHHGIHKILIVNPIDPNDKTQGKPTKAKLETKTTKKHGSGQWWLEDFRDDTRGHGHNKMSFKVNRDEEEEKRLKKEEHDRVKKIHDDKVQFEKELEAKKKQIEKKMIEQNKKEEEKVTDKDVTQKDEAKDVPDEQQKTPEKPEGEAQGKEDAGGAEEKQAETPTTP